MRNKIIYSILAVAWIAVAIKLYIDKVYSWQFWVALCIIFSLNNIVKIFKIDIFKSIRGKYHLHYICSVVGIICLFIYMATQIVYFAIASIVIGVCGLECMDKEKYIK